MWGRADTLFFSYMLEASLLNFFKNAASKISDLVSKWIFSEIVFFISSNVSCKNQAVSLCSTANALQA